MHFSKYFIFFSLIDNDTENIIFTIFCTCKTGYAILTKDVFECGALASMHFSKYFVFFSNK